MQIYEVIADRQYELQCSNTPRYKKYCFVHDSSEYQKSERKKCLIHCCIDRNQFIHIKNLYIKKGDKHLNFNKLEVNL